MFVGRDRELGVLEELASSGSPELFGLYGRRRVGRTELLPRLCENRRAVYFLAAQVRERDNLRAFRDCLRETLDDPPAGEHRVPGYLVDGEIISASIEGIGSLTHTVRAELSVPDDLSGAQLPPVKTYRPDR